MKNLKPKKQAPALEAFQIKDMEKIAANKSNPSGLRLLCSGIALMIHASLRWGDTLSITGMKLENGVISGIITSSKTADHPTEFLMAHAWPASLCSQHIPVALLQSFEKKS